MNKISFPVLALLLVTALGAFYGGMLYQKSQTPALTARPGTGQFGQVGRNGTPGVPGATGNARFAGGFRPITGEILSSSDTSLTIKLPDGSTKIVLLSSAPISNTTLATKTDLKVGTKVMAVGTENTDGSLSATSIQLNPLDRSLLARPSGSPELPSGSQPIKKP